MKRLLCLALMICLLCAPVVRAETPQTGDLLLVYYNCILYDNYDMSARKVLAYVPSGAVVMYIAPIEWGICVAYGSFVGYLEDTRVYQIRPGDSSYEFSLPDGSMVIERQPTVTIREDGSTSSGWFDWSDWQAPTPSPAPTATPWNGWWYPTPTPNTSYKTYVPEFPYSGGYARPQYSLSSRSGPGTGYTWAGSYSTDVSVKVFYQAEGSSTRWGYVEVTNGGQKYRVFTGMSRMTGYGSVPFDAENWVWAEITKTHTASYGPGDDYAKTNSTVTAGTQVKAFYQQNGWLMYEVTLSSGQIQRGWAPADCWK